MSQHWAEKDERLPCPLGAATIMGIQQQIMHELYGPIHDDTDVTIEMVNEVEKVMRKHYKPMWLNIVSLN